VKPAKPAKNSAKPPKTSAKALRSLPSL